MKPNNTEPVPTLRQMIDGHATPYITATMEYITGEITEEERDALYRKADEASLAQCERICASERQDEVFRVPLDTAIDLAIYKVRRRAALQTLIEETPSE